MKRQLILIGVLGLLALGSVAACSTQAASPLSDGSGKTVSNSAYENEGTNGSSMKDPLDGAAQTYFPQDKTPQIPVSDSQYEAFGLRYDESKNELFFDGELVRSFYDGVKLNDGTESIYCDFRNEQGSVDIHTIRAARVNKDGSINQFGELIGMERCSQEEFSNRDLSRLNGPSEAVTYVDGVNDPNAKTFSEIFEKYTAFGIEYVEAENASGAGNVYYNGQLVNSFVDISPNGGTFTFHSADSGKINVQTLYDTDGNLTGVEQKNRFCPTTV